MQDFFYTSFQKWKERNFKMTPFWNSNLDRNNLKHNTGNDQWFHMLRNPHTQPTQKHKKQLSTATKYILAMGLQVKQLHMISAM